MYTLFILINQVIVIPCGISANLADSQRKEIYDSCQKYVKILKDGGIRADCDNRDNYTAGWKFNHYEVKVSVTDIITLVIICSNLCKIYLFILIRHTCVAYLTYFLQLGCTTQSRAWSKRHKK